MDIGAPVESASSFTEIRLSETDLKKESPAAYCETCSRPFANWNAFRLHQVKTHNLVRGETDFALRHRARVTTEVRRYFCPIISCQYNKERSFKAYKLIHQHFSKVHCEKSFKCEKCEVAKFSLKRDLVYHQRKRCPMRDCSNDLTSTVKTNGYAKTEIQPKKPRRKNNWERKHSLTPRNFQSSFDIVNVHIPGNLHLTPLYREIRPKESPKATKGMQTVDDVIYHSMPDMCNVGSQTLQWDTFEIADPVLSEYADSHSQTYSACSVEFGTQIYPEDVMSADLVGKQNKTHDDFGFEDVWRHIETQTCAYSGSDALTQTAIDFMDNASMTDWDLL